MGNKEKNNSVSTNQLKQKQKHYVLYVFLLKLEKLYEIVFMDQ